MISRTPRTFWSLVFSGSVGQDLDVDDDWTLDSTPWTQLVDAVNFTSGSDWTTLTYGGYPVGLDAGPSSPVLHAGKFSYGWLILGDDLQSDTAGEDNGGGPVMEPRCWSALPNGSGNIATMLGSYSSSAGRGLHLEVIGGDFSSYGFFLVGTGDASFNPLMISSGFLCLATKAGHRKGRYNAADTDMNSVGWFDPSGVMQNLVSTSSTGSGFDMPASLPLTGLPIVQVGQSYHFQCWYREQAQGQSNFSTSLKVTF
ncbi:MAG: hypothetical protein ACI87O_002720 [Planctomycetota bacterium]|jgi:hypothetical protein